MRRRPASDCVGLCKSSGWTALPPQICSQPVQYYGILYFVYSDLWRTAWFCSCKNLYWRFIEQGLSKDIIDEHKMSFPELIHHFFYIASLQSYIASEGNMKVRKFLVGWDQMSSSASGLSDIHILVLARVHWALVDLVCFCSVAGGFRVRGGGGRLSIVYDECKMFSKMKIIYIISKVLVQRL